MLELLYVDIYVYIFDANGFVTFPMCAVYLGIVGSKDNLATEAFGLIWTFFALGGAVNYLISSSIPVSANLWTIVGLTVVTLIAYILAEAFHGEKLCTRKSPCPQKGEYSLRDHAAILYASSSQIF